METYSKIIICDEKFKEDFNKLSDSQQDFVCGILANNINQSMLEIENDILKRSFAEHKPTSDLA